MALIFTKEELMKRVDKAIRNRLYEIDAQYTLARAEIEGIRDHVSQILDNSFDNT